LFNFPNAPRGIFNLEAPMMPSTGRRRRLNREDTSGKFNYLILFLFIIK